MTLTDPQRQALRRIAMAHATDDLPHVTARLVRDEQHARWVSTHRDLTDAATAARFYLSGLILTVTDDAVLIRTPTLTPVAQIPLPPAEVIA